MQKAHTWIFVFLLLWSLAECTVTWFGLHSSVPALIIVINIILVILKSFHVIVNRSTFNSSAKMYSDRALNSHDEDFVSSWIWPLFLFLILDILTMILCKRNTTWFIIVSVIYTLASVGLLLSSYSDYDTVKNIRNGF